MTPTASSFTLPAMEALLTIDSLCRSFGEHQAVSNISFELAAGEVLGFLGPNAAGKSTTMRMISGCLAPSGGRVLIEGTDIQVSPELAKRRIGYLPETPPLYPDLTVNEYLRYSAQLRQIPSVEIDNAVTTAKQQCGLADYGERLIGNLSKGYQQRTGIAQAIIHNPALVILDEPTNGLDPNQMREIRTLIKSLGESRGVILSTHILSEVQAVCSRVEILNRGELVYSASMKEFADNTESTLLIGLSNPPELSALGKLPGVNAASAIDAHRFELKGSEIELEQIAQQALNQNWGLQELSPQRAHLEQIFTRLTATELIE